MQIDFVQVLLTVLSLVLLVVPGFLMVKLKIFPSNGAETISTLVLYCCQALLIFMSFQSYEFNGEIAIKMLIVAGLAFVVHLIMIGVVCLFVKGKQEAKLRCLRYGSVFSNCGYMGIPFLKMLFDGQEALGEILIFTAIILTVWNIFNWTLGVYLMTKDKKQVSFKKIILNPVIIALILGLLCFIILKKPISQLAEQGTILDNVLEKLMQVLNYFGDAVTPLSMTVIGMRLANVNFKQLFMDKLAYLCCFLKLILMSLISIFVCVFLPVDLTVKYAIFFCLSMPVASGTALFAVKFNVEPDFGSVVVLLSTILSILTIPLMYLLFGVFI